MKIAIIGFGEMGSLICKQLIELNVCSPKEFTVTRTDQSALKVQSDSLGVIAGNSNLVAANGAEIIILAVRPQVMPEILKELQPGIANHQVIISIAAGFGIDYYERFFPNNPIFRVVPNPYIESRLGIVAYSKNAKCNPKDVAMLRKLFGPLCESLIEITDSQMHAVTVLSSCSSAIYSYIFDSMQKAALKNGLTVDTARKIILESAKAASEHALLSGEAFEAVVNRASTPNGVTLEGTKALDENNVDVLISKAIQKMIDRSKEIGREPEEKT
jgi:pyrroline-5-carboxylate reductase